MVQFDPNLRLPSSEELPDSDDTPVDNEDQNYVPNLLLFILDLIWADRQDWYFGADMGIYHTTGVSPLIPVIPDGFLSLNVERRKGGKSRKSYVMWEENVPPILTLEMVSHTYGGEYDTKIDIYRNLGVLYYVIYNPDYWRRDGHLPLEIYRLTPSGYQLQIGEPFWMPEIGLGIGRGIRTVGTVQREVLYWFDRQGNRYLSPDELAQQAQQQIELAQQEAESERQERERLQQELDRYRQRFGDLE